MMDSAMEISQDKLSNKNEPKDSKSIESSLQKPEELSSGNSYELIDNVYYHTDKDSGKRFMYDNSTEKWTEVTDGTKSTNSVTVDDEGRQYYYSDNMYVCRDPSGNVFFMNESGNWENWHSKGADENKWYFYQGDDTFYRDTSTDKVYKLNKTTNQWELYEGKLKGKKRKNNDEEEFDTDEELSEEEETDFSRPPGFNNDPNISYDGTTYLKRDPRDGATYEWDVNRRAWFPKLDEDFMATYQLSYGFNPDGTKNENPLKFDDDEEEKTPQPPPEKDKSQKTEKKKPTWFDVDDAHNNKVYVSNLPVKMSEQEFVDLMQKCGLILKDTSTQNFKIKMYKDSDGNFKGDALCTYIRIESVDLALQILDGYCVDGKTISVERAKFTLKGSYDPSLKPKKKRKKELDKMQKKQEKLFDWRPEPMRGQRAKHEFTVILRNAFSPDEFVTNAEKILIHKEALRAQCSSFGAVKKIELYDRNPEGVLKVTFEEVEAADMCAATLHDRLYQKRRLRVATWDGKESFKVDETEEEKTERLKNWEEFLEQKSSDGK